ncbi:MATE family efflux transporter [Rheinheimera maricola]|uniref:MATE family efflux transporter n=1 Tax=Rheinheimera maricola TaxID=2793282 RepID=A0ABS7X745_9GAMM|nr:MATE family efflux transporter [Rheinheimera maricola]MBZ9610617.1 MATE family efflux transporter [Rheinheimera maricola]
MSSSPKAKPSLTNDEIKPTLIAMTLPMLVGMITLMTFNLVDTFFISMLGTEQLAAISFTFPVSFSLISLAIGLSIGTSAVIAKALGAGQLTEARTDGLVALCLSVVMVIILASAGFAFTDTLFGAMGATSTILLYIRQYMDIWFAGAVLLVLPMIGNAILRAAGDTKTPSIIMAGSGLVNAILDPILIFGWGGIPAMGMQGAALATLISWLFGSVLIVYLLVRRDLISTRWIPVQQLVKVCRKILRIGLPAAGANMLTPLAMAVLTAMMASYGAAAVAAFGVGARLESIACLVVLALSMTLPPFVSQNFGAGQLSRVQQAYRMCGYFVMQWQFAVYVLMAVLALPLARLFSDEAMVVNIICQFIWIVPLAYGLQGITILTNSSFNALHRPASALLLSIIRLFVLYVPLAWLGGHLFGIAGVFVGCVIANVITAAIAWSWFNQTVQRAAAMNAAQETI